MSDKATIVCAENNCENTNCHRCHPVSHCGAHEKCVELGNSLTDPKEIARMVLAVWEAPAGTHEVDFDVWEPAVKLAKHVLGQG